MSDVCDWSLEFSFRDNRRCKKFIKRLLRLPFTLTFTYDEYCGDDGYTRYRVQVEGSWAKNLTLVSKMMEKVDYQHE